MTNFQFLKKYSLTLIGLVISTSSCLFIIIMDIDLFENFVGYMNLMEVCEIDEFIIPFFIFFIFSFFDLRKRQKEYKIENEKLLIYKAMLSTSHHVLNNFLNQMQIFKVTAENTPDFDPDILNLYHEIMENASKQIDNLGNIAIINEESILRSVEPKLPSTTSN